jgi:hypothetical protein
VARAVRLLKCSQSCGGSETTFGNPAASSQLLHIIGSLRGAEHVK